MSFPKYEEYKDSGVDWLGEVPAHWEVAAIKHIVSTPVTDGPHETPEFIDEGVPFVSAEAVSSGEIDFSKIRGFISEADHDCYCQKYKPEVGDIYMVKSGASTGTTAIVESDQEFSIWSPLAAIRYDEDSLPRFVLNFLRSRNFQEGVTLNWSFGTQQNIGMNVIENLQVTRPPLDEQTAIASFLDAETSKIDGLVGEQRRLIELLKEKRQAVISHAVTKGLNPNAPLKPSGIQWLGDVPEHWEVVRLRRVGEVDQGCAFPHAIQGQEDGEIPWFKVKDMNQIGNEVCMSRAENYVDRALADEIGATIFPAGTVVFPRVGAALLTNKRRILICPAITDDNVYGFIPASIHSRFLYLMLLLVDMASICSAGLVPTVTFSVIKDLYVPLPPTAEQEEIVKRVEHKTEKLDQLVAESETAIELLQERRTALISAAVTGKIDVREFACEETI